LSCCFSLLYFYLGVNLLNLLPCLPGKALLCFRKKDKKRCIIKQISLAKMSPKEAKQTQQEASLLARLNHPNIVSFWDSFLSGSSLYIVMEFADGSCRILFY
jgi:serine/threonine protein kinase